jgi:hypothetical protein
MAVKPLKEPTTVSKGQNGHNEKKNGKLILRESSDLQWFTTANASPVTVRPEPKKKAKPKN